MTGGGTRTKLAPQRKELMNFDPKTLDDLARRLAESVPPGLASVRDDLERNCRAVLQSGLTRLDLVRRQDFDVQAVNLFEEAPFLVCAVQIDAVGRVLQDNHP